MTGRGVCVERELYECIRFVRMINWYQGSVLADRDLEAMLSDYARTLLLCMQAPLSAAATLVVWHVSDQDSAILCVMVVSVAFLMGCVNGAQAIARERAFFLRERMVNLEVGAYLYSKLRVLGMLDVVQLTLYLTVIYCTMDVPVAVGWAFLVAWLTSLCGTSLGLMLSSVFTRSNHAIGAVPLVVVPQIIVGACVSTHVGSAWLESLFKFMPVRWGYVSLYNFAQLDADPVHTLINFPVLVLFGALFLGVAVPCLTAQRH